MKILIGCPTSEHKAYCLNEYLEGLKNLTYKNADFIIVDNSKTDEYLNKIKNLIKDFKNLRLIKDSEWFEGAKDRIVHSRNLIRNIALKENYDYFLSLEQDVIPPKDVVERLLKYKKDLISGVVFCDLIINGQLTYKPMLWITAGKDFNRKELMRYLEPYEVEDEKLLELRSTSLSCLLISKKVLNKIKFRYTTGFDDVELCNDAIKEGFKIYVDTSIKCKHLIKGMDWSKIKK
ncbi:glycosyltransferase family 2 protein [Candidatus Woesearchaeota archaeon]|nr:glycosyltransferase family 2 protein [Candidatus Woesearchaeota archaeon]